MNSAARARRPWVTLAILPWNGACPTLPATQEDEAMELVAPVLLGWNKEQAELLRRIALAGGSVAVDDCPRPALEALISTGFVRMQGGDRVALTDAGLARARELRSSHRRKPPPTILPQA